MAQFFGSIEGQRGEATRLGNKSSGLVTEACSWQDKIVVRLTHNEATGKDEFTIDMEPHQGSGDRVEIAKGVIGDCASIEIAEAVL